MAIGLTDAQAKHIEAYKKMIDTSDIEKYISIKVENRMTDLKNDPDFVNFISKIMNKDLLDQVQETLFFIYYLLDKFKMPVEKREKAISNWLPLTQHIAIPMFQSLDVMTVENQKSQS